MINFKEFRELTKEEINAMTEKELRIFQMDKSEENKFRVFPNCIMCGKELGQSDLEADSMVHAYCHEQLMQELIIDSAKTGKSCDELYEELVERASI